MLPTKEQISLLHKKYASTEEVYELVYTHCQIVFEIARWCVDSKNIKVDDKVLAASCLLHDIGTYLFYEGGGLQKTSNKNYYSQHAILGARLLLDEGVDERVVQNVETHILMGLSKEDIASMEFPLPHKDYLPKTIEAELLCYADRFHSKTPQFNSFESFNKKLENTLPTQVKKFADAVKRFGMPDLPALAKKYSHPIV